jgi:hypothetical protein
MTLREESTTGAGQPASGELSNQEQLESFGYKQELKRSVSTADLLIYGLIFMVPIAPWAIFGTVYNASSGMASTPSPASSPGGRSCSTTSSCRRCSTCSRPSR